MKKITEDIILRIKQLREEGYSYSLIANILNISKSTISYYLSDSIKSSNKKSHVFLKQEKIKKICKFCSKEFFVTKRAKGEYCNSCLKDRKKGYKISLKEIEELLVGNKLNRNLSSNLNNKIKLILLEKQNNKCSICRIEPIWNDKRLIFILDHIDGISINNHISNLRCICPNCDSQLDTYKSKNKNSTRIRYSKKELETFDIEKIYKSLLEGNTFDTVRLQCGNPPKSLISKVMKERFPETITMNSVELKQFRNILFDKYLKLDCKR